MALQVTSKTRVFKYNDQELADPNPQMAPNEVAKFYSSQYPELVTASVDGPKIDGDKAVYSFSKNIGTKG